MRNILSLAAAVGLLISAASNADARAGGTSGFAPGQSFRANGPRRWISGRVWLCTGPPEKSTRQRARPPRRFGLRPGTSIYPSLKMILDRRRRAIILRSGGVVRWRVDPAPNDPGCLGAISVGRPIGPLGKWFFKPSFFMAVRGGNRSGQCGPS